jgi:hypothetical protein
MEPVGEHRELGGGGWGSAMKILGEMERDMERDAGPGDLSDRCVRAAAPDNYIICSLTACSTVHVGLLSADRLQAVLWCKNLDSV